MVRQIPKGKVATYGQIAKIVGTRNPQVVGWALHQNPDPKIIPCHRVVNKKGKLADGYAFQGWQEQKRRLEEEGITFKDKMYVELKKYQWQKRK